MSTFIMSLISMTITASIIIVVVIAMRFLLKKAPKVFSYLLWLIVLVRLLCPISISSSLSVFNIFDISTNDAGAMVYFDSSSSSDGTDESARGDQSVVNVQSTEMQDTYTVNETVQGQYQQNMPIQNSGDGIVESELSGISVAFIIWIAGAGILFIMNMISLIGVKRKTAVSIRLKDNVYLCDDISTPFCFGIIRPRIYLPSSLEKHERKYIYLHEKHHIKRFDHVVKCVAFLALCIHWFNPFVWLAFILAEKDMEMSCDEAVMRQMNDDVRKEYSYSLLRLASGKKLFIPSNLAFGDGNTKARIKNVMNYKKPVFWVVIVAVIACACLAVVLGTNPKKNAGDKLGNDAINGDSDISGNTNSGNETDTNYSQNGAAEAEIPEIYLQLIQRIEDAMYSGAFETNPEDFLDPNGNPICSSEFYHLYDGSSDIAYQNLGYLVLDIDKDGTPELLLGENAVSEDEEYRYDGVIYDLYTIIDGELVHLFGGWPRNRCYLTETNVIACEWASSAFYYGKIFYQYDAGILSYIEELIFDDQEENKGSITYRSETEERELYNTGEAVEILSKYQYVYPTYTPIGPIWKKVADLNGDGSNDYVIYTGRAGLYNHIIIYLAHEGIIYEYEDVNAIDVIDVCQIDIDNDGENEIRITMLTNVNSMPIEEYLVIKKTTSGWQEIDG